MFDTEVSFIASHTVALLALRWLNFYFPSSVLFFIFKQLALFCKFILFCRSRLIFSILWFCLTLSHHCLHAAEALHLVNELWGDFDGLLTGIHSRFFILRLSQLSAQGAYPVIRHDIIFIVRPREFENPSAAHAVRALPRTRHAIRAFGQSMVTLSSEQSVSCTMFDTSCTQFSW